MDLLSEFKTFSHRYGFSNYRDALSKIALIRSYRDEERKPKSRGKKGQPRSPAYLLFVSSMPCLICKGSAEAVLIHDNKVVKRNASDYSALPLCSSCSTNIRKFFLIEDKIQYYQNKVMQTYLRCIEGA